MNAPRINLAGQRFGRLVAIEYTGNSQWLCRCDCGDTLVKVFTNNLNCGNTRSCGCLLTESRIKHGLSKTKMHHAWREMINRCENPSNRAYRNYGARGIYVCERWKDFLKFLQDMGSRPSGAQIDRIDNDGPYEPDNCRWVSPKRNLNNRRDCRFVTFGGKTQTATEWAEEIGVNPRTLHNRLLRGWSVERALTEKVNTKP